MFKKTDPGFFPLETLRSIEKLLNQSLCRMFAPVKVRAQPPMIGIGFIKKDVVKGLTAVS